MTKRQLLNYAYFGALEAWETARKNHQKNPNEMNQKREAYAWEHLEEIQRMILQLK